MGREIRMVPADWQHPKDEHGNYIPLHDGFNERLASWDEENAKWQEGLQRGYGDNKGKWMPVEAKYIGTPFAEWEGKRPDPKDYMPDWPAELRTHMCMYETCSEGTPISPACATPEDCARWLTDNQASAFGFMTANYEQWLATCRKGHAISLVFGGGLPLRSGVELNAE